MSDVEIGRKAFRVESVFVFCYAVLGHDKGGYVFLAERVDSKFECERGIDTTREAEDGFRVARGLEVFL